MISAKFVPLKYYTLSSQLRRLTSFSVGLFGSANSVTRSYPVMRKSCIQIDRSQILLAMVSLGTLRFLCLNEHAVSLVVICAVIYPSFLDYSIDKNDIAPS